MVDRIRKRPPLGRSWMTIVRPERRRSPTTAANSTTTGSRR